MKLRDCSLSLVLSTVGLNCPSSRPQLSTLLIPASLYSVNMKRQIYKLNLLSFLSGISMFTLHSICKNTQILVQQLARWCNFQPQFVRRSKQGFFLSPSHTMGVFNSKSKMRLYNISFCWLAWVRWCNFPQQFVRRSKQGFFLSPFQSHQGGVQLKIKGENPTMFLSGQIQFFF